MFINNDLKNFLMVPTLEKVLEYYKKANDISLISRDTRYFMTLLKRLPQIDQHLFFNLYFRKLAVHAYPYVIKFPEGIKVTDTEKKQVVEMQNRWNKAYMHNLLDTSMNGRLIGLSAVELTWENTPYGNMVTTKKSYQPDMLDIDLEDDELITILDTDTATQKATRRTVDENKTFYIRYNPLDGLETDYPGAFIRVNFLAVILKYWDFLNWTKKNERSLTFAQYEERFKSQMAAILAQLQNIGDSSVGVFPKGVDVKVLEQLNQAQISSHKDLQDLVDKAISLTISGQATAANPASGHSFAASKIGYQIAENVTYADLTYIEKEISNQYIIHDYLANYTEPKNGFPIFEFKKYKSGDEQIRANIISTYVANNIPVHAEDMYDSVGLKRAITEEIFIPGGSAISIGAPAPAKGDPENLAAVTLNGAQITAATAIVKQVASGEMPRDAGVNQLMTFLNLSQKQAEDVMGSVTKKAVTPPGG